MQDILRFYKEASFQKKLLIFTISLVFFMGGTLGLLIRFIIFPYLIQEMEGRGINIAHRLAETTRTFVLSQDKVHLTALLFDEKGLEKNISYIMATDSEGKLLAHTFLGGQPQVGFPPRTSSRSLAYGDNKSLILTSGDFVLDIAFPIYAGLYQIGTIRVGLDKRFINDLLQELSLYHVGFISVITLTGLLFGFYLSRGIVKPIVSLTKLATEISQGNFNTRISLGARQRCWEILQCDKTDCPGYGDQALHCWFVENTLCENLPRSFPEKLKYCKDCPVRRTQRGDELVQLADTFNHMAGRLQNSEAALRSSEERYRQLFNFDPNPIFVLAIDSSAVQDVNNRAVQKYKRPKEAFVGMKFTDLGFEEDSALIMSFFTRIARGEKQCCLLSRIRHRQQGGEIFWVNIYICSYEHMGERSIIVATTDITEIIDTETKLIQASKMTTLGEMATGVAHELNQPLNTIKVGSEFLLTMAEQGQVVPGEDMQEVAREISKEVDRAAGIIRHLREFGRKGEILGQKININKPILAVFAILGQQLKIHDIEVITELEEQLPPILADENRIEQVLINLVNNARDAIGARRETGEAPGKLTIRSFRENDQVIVTVTDNGTGIPASIRERILEPFYTTKEVGRGTGLGLSISYGIIKDYKGSIDFDTREGEGTTFTLSFPQAPSGG